MFLIKSIHLTVVYLILGGVLLGLSFIHSLFWFLGLIALVPLIHFLFNAKNAKNVFLGGYVFGVAFFCIVFIWFWSALPLDWLGIDNSFTGFIFIFMYWITAAIAAAFFIGLFSVTFFKLKTANHFDLILFPFLWVLFEYLRMWGYAIFSFGSESLFEPHFSVGFIGYTLASNQNLLLFAKIGGVFMLSFVAVFINIFIYRVVFMGMYHHKDTRIYTLVLLLALFTVIIFIPFSDFKYTSDAHGRSTVKVALLNTYFPSLTEFTKSETERRFSVL